MVCVRYMVNSPYRWHRLTEINLYEKLVNEMFINNLFWRIDYLFLTTSGTDSSVHFHYMALWTKISTFKTTEQFSYFTCQLLTQCKFFHIIFLYIICRINCPNFTDKNKKCNIWVFSSFHFIVLFSWIIWIYISYYIWFIRIDSFLNGNMRYKV